MVCTAERTPVATVTTWIRVAGLQTGSAGTRTHSQRGYAGFQYRD